ncbi:uncharacterized protein LOC121372272 [Gigantopelta aegis]|uniref:uncharacterized protein LOC121372272 n=1 Tax=Gigantopelta aegis TaxID=1735272 RepID=UPI001B88A56D|nr:uncharacterized protein LOC121372272 [Gigantopelta aegis]
MTAEATRVCRVLSGTPPGHVGVIAGTDLPTLASTGPYPAYVPIGVNTRDEHDVKYTLELNVNIFDFALTRYAIHTSPNGLKEASFAVHYEDGRLLIKHDVTGQWPRPLQPAVDVTQHWPQFIQPARDRHEQNVEAYRDERDNVHLRVQRPIRRREELLVWYSDDLARCVGIPFLTPDNIRGNQEYMCSKCRKTYKYPNTLKAHIRFRCVMNQADKDRFTNIPISPLRSVLGLSRVCDSRPLPPVGAFLPRRCTALSPPGPDSWYRMRRKTTPLQLSELSAFKPHITKGEQAETEPDSTVQSSTSPGSDSGVLNLSTGEQNAANPLSSTVSAMPLALQIWKPFHQPAIPITMDALTLCYPYFESMHKHSRLLCSTEQTPSLSSLSARSLSSYDRLLTIPETNLTSGTGRHGYHGDFSKNCAHAHSAADHGFGFPLPSEQEGEPLDLLPRSLYLSKSRKGHLCIYCGKLYSRKYGLKIHLRTHTGYKPLKCKVCLRPFGDPSNLNKHVRLHAEGDTPYRCQYCGKVLVRRRDLERHVKSRHPQEVELNEETMIDSVDTTTDNVDSDQSQIIVA